MDTYYITHVVTQIFHIEQYKFCRWLFFVCSVKRRRDVLGVVHKNCAVDLSTVFKLDHIL